MRFLFRILARRRAMPTKSLYMHSKPLSVFVFCTRSCPREAYFLSLRFLLDARGQRADTLHAKRTDEAARREEELAWWYRKRR